MSSQLDFRPAWPISSYLQRHMSCMKEAVTRADLVMTTGCVHHRRRRVQRASEADVPSTLMVDVNQDSQVR